MFCVCLMFRNLEYINASHTNQVKQVQNDNKFLYHVQFYLVPLAQNTHFLIASIFQMAYFQGLIAEDLKSWKCLVYHCKIMEDLLMFSVEYIRGKARVFRRSPRVLFERTQELLGKKLSSRRQYQYRDPTDRFRKCLSIYHCLVWNTWGVIMVCTYVCLMKFPLFSYFVLSFIYLFMYDNLDIVIIKT